MSDDGDWMRDMHLTLMAWAMNYAMGDASLPELASAWAEAAQEIDRRGGGDEHLFHQVKCMAKTQIAKDTTNAYGDVEQDEVTVVEMVDAVTGQVIDDPDAESANEPVGVAALAYSRLMAAFANKDEDTARAIWLAAMSDEREFVALRMHVMLAETTGHTVMEHLYQHGELTDAGRKVWEERRLAQQVDAPAEPEVTVQPDGSRTVRLPMEDDDLPPGAGMTEDAVYAVTIRIPGEPVTVQMALGNAHEMMADVATRKRLIADGADKPLCGVMHYEDVEVWQLPKPIRATAARALRDTERQIGKPGQLMRIWQHRMPCEESLSEEDRRHRPGPDDVPLFDV